MVSVSPTLAMAPISSDLLATFIAVSERLSVSQAAVALGCAKGVVSKRIAQLEARVGTTLFSRSTRKIVLTPAAEAYLPYARRALAEIIAGQECVRAQRDELTGRIRLTAPVSWGQHVLARRLPEFLRRHPEVEIDLILADRMFDLATERIDMALRWSASAPPELTAAPVATIRWVLAAAHDYLARAGVPTEPADLTAHSCLCYWRDSSDERWSLSRCDEAGAVHRPAATLVHARGRYHVDNPDAVAQAALSGLGIALLPDYLCLDALHDGRLIQVLPQWIPQTQFGTGILVVAAPERLRLRRNRLLWEFLALGR